MASQGADPTRLTRAAGVGDDARTRGPVDAGDGGPAQLTPNQFARVEQLYCDAQNVPPDQRRAYLDAHCADDPRVRAEVEGLLRMGSNAPSTAPLHGQFDSVIREREQSDVRGLIGRRVGAYHIIDMIGRGGMGIVLLGRDTRLQRLVALKIVPASFAHDPQRLARFLREARILASLSHPNIATVFGLEEHDGRTLLVMEYIDGQPLSDRLGKRPMPLPDALAVACQMACGIQAAHDAGVIHRDLKPGNVMFTGEGRVKVLDFGLATEAGVGGHDAPTRGPGELLSSDEMTRTGSVFGTPAYMSPEQVRGRPLDKRTDVFSFGCILFKCLSGETAFDGESDAEIIAGIIQRDPDWSKLPKNTPPGVRRIIRRCMAKDVTDRYHDMGDVRLDLEEALEAREWLNPAGAPQPKAARPILPWLVAAGLAIVAGGLLIHALQRPAAPEARSDAAPQRLDLSLPRHVPQRDLERVQLAVSPDGQSIAVACTAQDGMQHLWLRSHADGIWRPVEQTTGAHRPFFSPDGQWIGFYRDGHLYKRRLTGGEPVRMATATNWYGASWTDDGLIYSPAWGDPIATLDAAEPRTDAPPRFVTRLDADQGEGTHVSPTAVPGTPWLLYNVWTGGEECAIHATNRKTGDERVVVANASTPRVARTPRGDYLLFERANILFAAPFDRATATPTGGPTAIVEGVMNDGTRFAAYYDVSPDGTLVYFPGTAFAEESRLAWVGPDGSTIPMNEDRLSFCEPVFAYNGTKAAALVKGKLYRALVYDLRNLAQSYLVTGGDTASVAMSPDAHTVACTVNRDGGYGIDLISLTGGRRQRISPPGADYQSDLCWSSDGRHIVFSMSPREGSPRDVWVYDVERREQRPIVATPAADSQAMVSPDCRWLAYASDVSGRREAYVTGFPDGGQTHRISTDGGAWPAWSPDGRTLYFVSDAGLVSVGLADDGTAAGRPTVVYDRPFGQSDPLRRDFTVSPDGRVLLVEPSERRPSVTHLQVITNWHQLLPR